MSEGVNATRDVNPRLTEHEAYYLRSILKMIEGLQTKVRRGPTLYSEALGDNREWLEMFIESHEQVFDKNDLRKEYQRGEEDGYNKAVADLGTKAA